jgi:NAD(P)-dependent dehydrogenase (short-subunit alcohol dehydrogenase family)
MSSDPTILIAGASRGLGLALAEEFARRGWHVIGTVRGGARTDLHDLAEQHPDRIAIETLDINEPTQIAALHDRLSGRTLDMLFVNAGISTADPRLTAATIDTEQFVDVMVTNALSPMRVIDALAPLVPADGLIGVMTSGQGSIANNDNGRNEVYRSSKAALNQMMRSFAQREPEPKRAMMLMAPGWIRTALGTDQATYSVEESTPILVDLLIAKRARPGLEYLDRFGEIVPW